MGFRTVVVLFNDQASEWENDPALGKKISHAMNFAFGRGTDSRADIGYGRVVECAHADTQTLAVLDSYNMTQIAHASWRPHTLNEEAQLELLKNAAEKLGYKIVKA
ncbi:MAG: hypothetical protein K2X81_19350 [Candidatus Obscuribacterales bacterium]|nr:hypothetical protein [Candidatus Obscuribacterales bacterium]